MPSLKLCPKCNCLPTVHFNKRFVRCFCTISCPNFGCPQFYPIVTTGFSENSALQKAAEQWNERVETGASPLL